MLMPSTITALRTRRYDSTWYIPGTIHGVDYDPMDDGRWYGIQPPDVSDLSACVVQFNSAVYSWVRRGNDGEGRKGRGETESIPGRFSAFTDHWTPRSNPHEPQDIIEEVEFLRQPSSSQSN